MFLDIKIRNLSKLYAFRYNYLLLIYISFKLQNFSESKTRISAPQTRYPRGIRCNYVGGMLLSLDLTCPHLTSSDVAKKKVARVKKVEDHYSPPLHNVFRRTTQGMLPLA